MRGKKSLEDAMQQFSVIVQKLKTPEDLDTFREFVFQCLGEPEMSEEEEDDHHDCSGHDHDHHHDKKAKHDNNNEWQDEEFITYVIDELRKEVPVSGEAPGEKFYIPKNDEYKDYTEENTIHVDSFLYGSQADIDDLCDAGKLSTHYCADCKSKNCKPFNFVSHSATLSQLRFIFEQLGPCKGKTVVDVGSRLGAVLFTGIPLSKANFIGIEKDKFFCEVQQKMLKKLDDKAISRIKVIHDDVLNQKDTLQKADVIVMNNVFEFFAPGKELENLWKFIVNSANKKGCKIITVPAIQKSLSDAGIQLNIDKWVKEIPLEYPETDDEELDEDYKMVHMYEVL